MYAISNLACAHVKAVLANENYSHMEDANQREQQLCGDYKLKTAGTTWAAKMLVIERDQA